MDTKGNNCHTVGFLYGVNGKSLHRYCKDFMSDFSDWNQKSHAEDYL